MFYDVEICAVAATIGFLLGVIVAPRIQSFALHQAMKHHARRAPPPLPEIELVDTLNVRLQCSVPVDDDAPAAWRRLWEQFELAKAKIFVEVPAPPARREGSSGVAPDGPILGAATFHWALWREDQPNDPNVAFVPRAIRIGPRT